MNGAPPLMSEGFDEYGNPLQPLTVGEVAAQGIPLPMPDPNAPIAPAPVVSPITGAPLGAPPPAPAPDPAAPGALPPAPGPTAAPGVPGLPLTKTQTQTTTTRERQTAGEQQAQKGLAANDAQARTNLQDRQKLDDLVAETTRVEKGEDTARKKAALDAHDAELSRLKGVASSEEAKYKQQLTDFANPKNGYYADMTTADKIGAGISLVLGLVGGLTDGSNVGAERIIKAVDADTAKRRALLEAQERIVSRAKGDVGDARANLAYEKEMLDLRAAVGLEAAVSRARGRAQMLGIDENNLRKNEQLQKLEAEALDRRAKHEEGLRTKATTTSVSVAGGPNGAAGSRPTEAQARLALLGTSMQDELKMVNPAIFTPQMLAQLQRQGDLAAAGERTAKAGLFGAIGAGFARMLGLPQSKYQGLSNEQQVAANAIDNALEKYTRLLTGAGMPVEEAVRMATQSAPHAGDSPAAVASKLARLDSEARRMIALSGNAGVTAGNVERVQPTPTPAPGPAPAAAPAPATGGKRVRLRDGRVGTLYPDGKFQAD